MEEDRAVLPKDYSSESLPDDQTAMDKIAKLVENAVSMQKIAEEKTRATEQYFNTLRDRLSNSTTFLDNIKRDIENIKFSFARDQDHNDASFYEYCEKTDEEMDQEIQDIKKRLEDLQGRAAAVQTSIEERESFETTMAKAVKTLDNIAKGLHSNDSEKDD